MKILLATGNAGKISEFRALLLGLPLEIATLREHPEAPEVEETGDTYRANALAKARAAAEACGLPALADDSGLEVDALGGRPGVRSARYSGGGAEENVALLLRQLDGLAPDQRTARFRCVLALVWPGGDELVVEGTCEGRIAEAPRGGAGFGYDPIFVDPATGRTFAELPPGRKEATSHRARAVAELRVALRRVID